MQVPSRLSRVWSERLGRGELGQAWGRFGRAFSRRGPCGRRVLGQLRHPPLRAPISLYVTLVTALSLGLV